MFTESEDTPAKASELSVQEFFVREFVVSLCLSHVAPDSAYYPKRAFRGRYLARECGRACLLPHSPCLYSPRRDFSLSDGGNCSVPRFACCLLYLRSVSISLNRASSYVPFASGTHHSFIGSLFIFHWGLCTLACVDYLTLVGVRVSVFVREKDREGGRKRGRGIGGERERREEERRETVQNGEREGG